MSEHSSVQGDSDWDLDAAATYIAALLCREAGFQDERWVAPYLSRHGWGQARLTLDQIGRSLGVTRERVRQVIQKIDSRRPMDLDALPEALAEAALAVDWGAPDGELSALLGDLGMTDHPEGWTADALIDLVDACGRSELASELKRRQAQGVLDRKVSPEMLAAVRKARSGLGVLDLRAVRYQGEWLSPEQALRIAQSAYAVVVPVGAWALCRGKRPSSIENAALQQLTIAPVLTAHEIFQGISRTGRNRNWQVPPESVAIDLLREVGLIEPSEGGYHLASKAETVKFGSIEQWLLDVLGAEEPPALPVEELLRRGRHDGLKPASLNVYFTFSAIVRRQHGLVSLVGADLSTADVELLQRAANAAKLPSKVSFAAHPGGVELGITLGTAYMTSGVISVRRSLAVLIGDRKRGFRCCEQSHFGGVATLEPEGRTLWYGWAPLFNHWVAAHGVEEGQTVRVLMSPEVITCLEPWAEVVKPVSAVSVEHAAISMAAPAETLSSMVVGDEVPASAPSRVTTSQAPSQDPVPGEVWPETRGHRILVLSPRLRDLLVPGTKSSESSKPLADLVGDASKATAQKWLEIRPSGGRVWVDRNGHACTLIDDQLIYLGAVPEDWSW